MLTIWLSVLGVVPVLLTAGLLATRAAKQRRAQGIQRVEEEAVAICRATEAYVDMHIAGVRDLAAGMSGVPNAPSAALSTRLARFHQHYGGFITVLAADRTGAVVAAHPARRADSVAAIRSILSVADRPYFQVPMRTARPFVSEAFRGRGFGQDPIVAVAAPVLDGSGRPAGIVEGSFDLTKLGRFDGGFQQADGTTFIVLDRDDRVIYASAPSAGLAPLTSLRRDPLVQAMTQAEAAAAERFRIVTTAAIGGPDAVHGATCRITLGWRVVVRLPQSMLRREMREFYRLGAVVAVAVAIAALILAGILARRIAEPLARLARAADGASGSTHEGVTPLATHAVDEGVLADVERTSSAPVEVRLLANRLHRMAGRISAAESDLRRAIADREGEIETRTRELSASHAALSQSESRLRLIHESTTDLLFLMRVDAATPSAEVQYVCESVNDAYMRVTGLQSSQLIGRTAEEILPPGAAVLVRQKYDEAVATRGVLSYDDPSTCPEDA